MKRIAQVTIPHGIDVKRSERKERAAQATADGNAEAQPAGGEGAGRTAQAKDARRVT